jgi:glycosyltransferase involved in cell wall biosynthesis
VHRAARIARAAGVPLKIAAKLREPAEHEYYDATVAPLLGGDIEYVGEVNGAEKLELLASAMCLLNPIAWPEPFGLAMVEALACGTPVVAPPCGSVPEIVEDDVVGFVRPDEEAMSAVLQRVDELDRAQCRKRAERCFSTSLMVTKHLELYQRVVTTGVSAAPSHREPGCLMPTAPA